MILFGKKKPNPKTFSISLYSDIYRPISFKPGLVIETTELYILVLVWMTMTFIHVHSCIRNKIT